MRPPFKKASISEAVELAISKPSKRFIMLGPTPQIINKSGPFKLSKVSENYPYFSALLNLIVQEEIRELPDFSDDSNIAVMTDFGGEHKGALFNTYSLLFMAYNKVGVFGQKIIELRNKHSLLAPYSEFAYKKLKSGDRSRALQEYLQLVDQYIHGVIITVAIDNKIKTLFGSDKQQTYPVMTRNLAENGLGEWSGPTAEKVLRVTHLIAAFSSLLTHENQRLLWYSDNDPINDDGKKRDFNNTQQIFTRALAMYLNHSLDLVGFGKSFNDKSHLDDLLSVPDLAAGVVQDLLSQHYTQEDIPGGHEKEIVMKWIATPAKYLSKITLQITKMPNGENSYGAVDMTVNDD